MYDYWIWDKVVPKWFCEEQIKNTNWENSSLGLVKTNNGYDVNKNIRISETVFELEESPIGCIAQRFIHQANKKAGWNFVLNESENIQIGKYDAKSKGFYDWHQDDGWNPKNGLIRKISISILLNDDFEGGFFEFKHREKQPTLSQGSIIVFPSLLEHRVTPVTKGIRYSAVTWFNGPSYK